MAARCWAARRPKSSVLINRRFSPPAKASASVSGRSKSACRTVALRSAKSESTSGRRVVRMTSEAGTRSKTSSALKRPSWPDAPVMTMLIEPAFLKFCARPPPSRWALRRPGSLHRAAEGARRALVWVIWTRPATRDLLVGLQDERYVEDGGVSKGLGRLLVSYHLLTSSSWQARISITIMVERGRGGGG